MLLKNINSLKQTNNSKAANIKRLCGIKTGCYCKILVFWPNKLLLFCGTFWYINEVLFGLLGLKAVRIRQTVKNGIYKGLRNAHR